MPWQEVLIKPKGKGINYLIACCELAGGCRRILTRMLMTCRWMRRALELNVGSQLYLDKQTRKNLEIKIARTQLYNLPLQGVSDHFQKATWVNLLQADRMFPEACVYFFLEDVKCLIVSHLVIFPLGVCIFISCINCLFCHLMMSDISV